jgi:hypothetical protein
MEKFILSEVYSDDKTRLGGGGRGKCWLRFIVVQFWE